MTRTFWLASRCAARTALFVLATGALACGSSDKDPGPPTPTEELVVTVDRPLELTEQARIPQNDASFERAEVSADSVVLFYRQAPAEVIDVGHVIAGTGAPNTYLRRVTAVTERSDTRVVLATEPAYITDFIVDGAFTVDFTPGAAGWEVDAPHDIGGRTLPLETELSIFKFGPDGFECNPVGGGEPVMIKPVLDPDLSHRVKVDVTSTFYPIAGELDRAEFSMTGKVTVGLEMEASLSAGVQCTIDLIAYLRDSSGNPNRLKFKRHVTFSIGPVPMEITVFLEPVFKFEATETGKIARLVASATGTLDMHVGVAYGTVPLSGTERVWTPIWEHDVTGSVTADLSEDVGELTASGKGIAGFQIGALLYDTIGPTVSLNAFLQDKIEVNPLECSYVATASYGLDLGIGVLVQVPVIAKEIAKVSESFNLTETVIARVDGTYGECVADAGPVDSGIADAGVPDASPIDAAMVDASVSDAAPIDASMVDASSPELGRMLVHNTSTGSHSDSGFGLWSMLPDGTDLRIIVDPVTGPEVFNPRLSPSGTSVAYVAGTVRAIHIASIEGVPLGAAIAPPVDYYYEHVVWSPALPPPAVPQLLFSSTEFDGSVFKANLDGSGKVRLTPDPLPVYWVYAEPLDWSPDGTKFLLWGEFGDDGDEHLYVGSTESASLTRINGDVMVSSFTSATNAQFVSNDRVVFVGSCQINAVDADGLSAPELIVSGTCAARPRQMRVSPDRTKLAYNPGSTDEIHVVGVDGSSDTTVVTSVANGEGIKCIDWSPDGQSIVYDDYEDIRVVEVANPDNNQLVTTMTGYTPCVYWTD